MTYPISKSAFYIKPVLLKTISELFGSWNSTAVQLPIDPHVAQPFEPSVNMLHVNSTK